MSPASGRPERRRRVGAGVSFLFALVLVAGGSAMTIHARAVGPRVTGPIVLPPAAVLAPLRVDGALVRGAARNWVASRTGPLAYGEPVPIQITAYCLKGLTRRDRYVRQGIVAADPRIFPLGRYVEVYVGREYHGRFLVDDTGGKIKDAILDIWTPSCKDARQFGRRRGTAVLVPRPRGVGPDSLMTGRLQRPTGSRFK